MSAHAAHKLGLKQPSDDGLPVSLALLCLPVVPIRSSSSHLQQRLCVAFISSTLRQICFRGYLAFRLNFSINSKLPLLHSTKLSIPQQQERCNNRSIDIVAEVNSAYYTARTWIYILYCPAVLVSVMPEQIALSNGVSVSGRICCIQLTVCTKS